MAVDEYFLQQIESNSMNGILRFYSWYPPAISFGQFFKTKHIDQAKIIADKVVIVRRPTGGNAIFHSNDFTYSLIIKKGIHGLNDKKSYYLFIAEIIKNAISVIGLDAIINTESARNENNPDCFYSISEYEIALSNGTKLVGSAQKITHKALLQHGTFLYPYKPEKLLYYFNNPNLNTPEIKKDQKINFYNTSNNTINNYNFQSLSILFKSSFEKSFNLIDYKLTNNDINAINKLVEDKYSKNEWNYKK